MANEKVDVVIVGAGASGSVYAAHLGEGATYYELATGHDCMITDPRNVIRILLENA